VTLQIDFIHDFRQLGLVDPRAIRPISQFAMGRIDERLRLATPDIRAVVEVLGISSGGTEPPDA
jgi:hypothetical protein